MQSRRKGTSAVKRKADYRSGFSCEALEERALLTAVGLFQEYQNVDWTSGGAGGISAYTAGLQESWQQGSAAIRLPLVPTNIEKAWLIWQGIDRLNSGGDGVYDNSTIYVFGAAVTHLGYGQVTGQLVGESDTANWGDGSSATFVADVTPYLSGQGLQVGGLSAKPGHSANGVSLIVVYRDLDSANNRDIAINIGNQNRTDPIELTSFAYNGSTVKAQLHVADGQSFADAPLQFSNGVGSMSFADTSSLLDGNSVLMVGQSRGGSAGLWDIHNFDLSPMFTAIGATPASVSQLRMELGAGSGDSLKWISLITEQPSVGNRAPVAEGDRFELPEDSGAVGGVFRASDMDGQPLSFQLVNSPASGELTLVNGGRGFTYQPVLNFNGVVEFAFTAYDGQAYSQAATITIEVTAVNDAPEIVAQTVQLPENSPPGTRVTTMDASDVDSTGLVYSIVQGNEARAFVIDSVSGVVSVVNGTPLDFETAGPFQLAVRVTDSAGLYDEAILQIQLTDILEFIPVQLLAPQTITTSDNSLTVTLLSSALFNPTQVNISSIQLSINNVNLEIVRNKRGVPKLSYADMNGDGVADLAITFEIPAGSLTTGEFRLRIEGSSGGEAFVGEASGKVVAPSKGGKGGGKPNR